MIQCSNGNLCIRADEVRCGDVLLKTYGRCPVFEVYENRRGTISICAEAPWGQHEYRHRPNTTLVVYREQAHPTAG